MIKKALTLSFISTAVSLCFLLFYVLKSLMTSSSSVELFTLDPYSGFNSILIFIPSSMIILSLLISTYAKNNNIKLTRQERFFLSYPFIYAGFYIATLFWLYGQQMA